jgi:hypothetical protein
MLSEQFTKSSFSVLSCVEVAYRKSSFCGHPGCVEVGAGDDGHVHMRDSKDPDGTVLTFTREEWELFLAGAKAGEFDLPLPRAGVEVGYLFAQSVVEGG